MLTRLARRCYHRRRLVTLAWVGLLVLAVAAGSQLAGKWSSSGRLPGTESQRAYDLLKLRFPGQAGEDGSFVFADVTRNRATVDAFLAQAATVDGVAHVEPLQVSPEGHVAIASFTFPAGDTVGTKAAVVKLRQLADPVNQNGGGVEFASRWFDAQTMPSSEGLGLLAAVVVLLVAFGSVLAMGLPLVTAMLGIGITVALIGIMANFVNTADFTPQVATMIGLGVGIDYALFIVTRYRDALGRRGSPEEAVAEAISTAGRAVAFAGCTVMISVLGMFLMGLDFLYGMALGTALAVLVAVAAALTLLPALLGFLGHNIDKLRVRRRPSADKVSGWTRWANFVQRHPKPVAATGLVVLVAAALPVFALHLGMSDAGNDPKTTTTRAAYDLVAKGFGPGANGPVIVVIDTSSQGSSKALPALVKALRAAPGVAAVTDARPSASGKAAIATLIATTGPQTRATETLLHDLRDTVIPTATAGTGLVVHLGGQTASGVDFATVIGHRLPIFIFAVLALSFLLLLVVFRSVLVPLKAVLMNLLSIGAAYGVMVAVFQWGWLGQQVGVSGAPIEAWAPMMLFAIVFGLSMDYEVFLLSAVKEHYDATGDNAHSVAQGLAATARLITAAALIMVLVFGSFVLSDLRALKLIGLGLAVAVAVDATIVRIVLVPATMELLGNANWWLPRWLDRILPRLAVDAPRPDDQAPPASERELVGAGRP
jgi:RND superfamily putative drug exporter